MKLNESIVEDAALVMPVASLTPALSEESRATIRQSRRVQIARRTNP